MREIGSNTVGPHSVGTHIAACVEFGEVRKFLAADSVRAIPHDVLEQAVIDASYCIDATEAVPIGGVIVSGGPGAKGYYKPDGWKLPTFDDTVWMSGHAMWTRARPA